MKAICIIPARGGSKRIPRKNIKDFLGKPIIAYSIETALQSGLFDEVMVSTDDEEIARVAEEYGAKVPFFRSAKNADDFTGPGDVVYEVLNQYKGLGIRFDLACCLYATAPLVQAKSLKEGKDLILNQDFDLTFPVGKYSSPVLRSYKIDSNGRAQYNWPEFETFRSQDLDILYFDSGQFYWFYPQVLSLLKNKNSFGTKKGVVILNETEVQDIDEFDDWKLAEMKYKLLTGI